ncbi:MAG: hypothetical protein AB7L71_17950, partial [Vicinamibacterales bacterium]
MKRLIPGTLLAVGGLLCLAAILPLRAQKLASALSAGEWIDYGGDYSANRYSPLSQITPANVAKLQVA